MHARSRSSIIRTREARTAGIVVNSLSRHPETHSTNSQTNSDEDQVDNGEDCHPRRGGQTTLVDVQPEDATQAVTEPGSEQSSLRV